MSSPQSLDLPTVLSIVARRAGLILVIAAAAAGLAFGWSTQQEERFEARAKLLFRAEEPVPRIDPNDPLPDPSRAPERVAATNLALASLDSVAVRVKQRLGSSATPEALRKRVDVAPEGQTDIVTVTAQGPTRAEAVRLANTFALEVIALRRENAQRRIQRVIDAVGDQLLVTPPQSEVARELGARAERLKVEKRLAEGDVELVQPATRPRDRSAPKPVRNAGIGFGLGLVLGVLLSLLLHRLDRRITNEEEIAQIAGAPIIARIPVGPRAAYKLRMQQQADWEQQRFLEAFQFLRSNLQHRDAGEQLRVVAITSALAGNGKTTVAANLAEALALGDSDVIVVDFDLRRPALHERFGLPSDDGVTTAIARSTNPVDLLQQTADPGVRLLAAGRQIALPGSIIAGSSGVSALISQLEEEADYILIDTSPVTIAADASTIAARADATLVVVDAQNTERRILTAAVEQLRNAHANIVGVVLNRAPVLLKDHDYKGYYPTGTNAPTSPTALTATDDTNGTGPLPHKHARP